MTTIPLVQQPGADDRLVVQALLDGRNLKLFVDTGAETSAMSRSVLTGHEDLEAGADLIGIGGRKLTETGMLNHMQLGDLHGGISAAVADYDFGDPGQPVAGVLGMNVLGNYDVDIDLAGGRLGLYRAMGDCSGTADAGISGPLFGVPEARAESRQELSPVIEVEIAGKILRAGLDTGSPLSVMALPAAHRIGVTDAALAADRRLDMTGIGDQPRTGFLHRVDAIRLGDLEMRNVPVDVLDQGLGDLDMLLGMDFFRRAHVWISNSSHTIVLQVPPSATTELPTE